MWIFGSWGYASGYCEKEKEARLTNEIVLVYGKKIVHGGGRSPLYLTRHSNASFVGALPLGKITTA